MEAGKEPNELPAMKKGKSMGMKALLKKLLYTPPVSWVYVLFNLCRDSNLSLWKMWTAKRRNYLFMIAMHNNAGDLAQTVCIDEWLCKYDPQSVTINVAYTCPNDRIVRNICKTVRPQDRVFIHSGFNITDICGSFYDSPVFKTHKIILESLPEHRIVFFPQSVECKNREGWEAVSQLYAKHKDIVFVSRDLISQQYAKALLPGAKHLAYPDIVTTWIGQYDFPKPTKDIFLCLRFGEESKLTDSQKQEIYEKLSALGTVGRNDTDVAVSAFRYRGHRKEVVLEKIREFSQYKVVVTDRYHGVVFALVSGRPVVVLKTVNHKVTSALAWFPKAFEKYVYPVESDNDPQEIERITRELLAENMPPLKSRYFADEVYAKLAEDIAE